MTGNGSRDDGGNGSGYNGDDGDDDGKDDGNDDDDDLDCGGDEGGDDGYSGDDGGYLSCSKWLPGVIYFSIMKYHRHRC